MALDIKDRVPTKPNRVLITPEDGSAPFYGTITRADEPTQEGTPINKELLDNMQKAENVLISDELAENFNIDENKNIDSVMLKTSAGMWELCEKSISIPFFYPRIIPYNDKLYIFNFSSTDYKYTGNVTVLNLKDFSSTLESVSLPTPMSASYFNYSGMVVFLIGNEAHIMRATAYFNEDFPYYHVAVNLDDMTVRNLTNYNYLKNYISRSDLIGAAVTSIDNEIHLICGNRDIILNSNGDYIKENTMGCRVDSSKSVIKYGSGVLIHNTRKQLLYIHKNEGNYEYTIINVDSYMFNIVKEFYENQYKFASMGKRIHTFINGFEYIYDVEKNKIAIGRLIENRYPYLVSYKNYLYAINNNFVLTLKKKNYVE